MLSASNPAPRLDLVRKPQARRCRYSRSGVPDPKSAKPFPGSPGDNTEPAGLVRVPAVGAGGDGAFSPLAARAGLRHNPFDVRRFLLHAIPWALAALFLFTTIKLLFRRPKDEPAPDSAPVVTAMNKVARLATVEIQVSDVVKYESFKSFLFLSFPKSAILRVRGSVLGGFDLDRGGLTVRADPAARRVAIRLPRPSILAIDPKLEWFDEQSGMFNPITPEDRTRWMAWARSSLGRAARQAGMDAKAEEQAGKLLSGAAEALGWKAAVTFDASPASPLP
jgi:hypothetical protein